MGDIRIIGGLWRSRKLEVLEAEDLRPTPDRVRETVFNWLQGQIRDARVLDLFAGTGILSFESLSRSASAAVLIEKNATLCTHIRCNAQRLNTNIELHQTNVLDWLNHKSVPPFNGVFIDPPYQANLLTECFHLIEDRGLLLPNAWIYAENATPLNELDVPVSWQLTHLKKAGMVHFGLWKKHD